MIDPTRRNPQHVTIKVTDNSRRCYFVHFDRKTGELVNVDEYKMIYIQGMGVLSPRIQAVVDAAVTRLATTPNVKIPEGVQQ
jgi:hypothetical protein